MTDANHSPMTGADSLVKTLLASGVDTCFANPGTSEMHFVAALDQHLDMKCVLCLFEGGVTGAADGYYRMAGKPAATLLHLAPGFGNGYANLHNARKAPSGIVNVVGDHADYHLRYESPLKGDLVGVSQAVSHWTRVSPDAASVATDGAAAVQAARANNGQIATLILPANTAWEEGGAPVTAAAPPVPHRPDTGQVAAAATALRRPGAALLLGGAALHGAGAELAGKIAAATGCRLLSETLISRIDRGAGSVMVERLKYPVLDKIEALRDTSVLVQCGLVPPVGFFAYPGKPSVPTPPDCEIMDLCLPHMDVMWTLRALAEACDAGAAQPVRFDGARPDLPTGALTLEAVGAALAALMPEGAIVVDEGVTSSAAITPVLLNAGPFTSLQNTGGSIGIALPLATGAAVACPDRPVIVLEGDGSAMYTIQSLWTMAREGQNVTALIFANRTYRILHGEMEAMGMPQVGRNATEMLDLDRPDLDFVALARGHGVPAARVETADGLVTELRRALAEPGPHLIEVPC